MGLTYKVGGGQGIIPGGPKKIKKAKQQSAEDVGRAGRADRMKRFNTTKEKKKVDTLFKINTKSQQAIDEGLKLNGHHLPLGDSEEGETGEKQSKKFNLFQRKKAKFEKNSR